MDTPESNTEHPVLEKIAASLLAVIMGGAAMAVLLGVYALADLVF